LEPHHTDYEAPEAHLEVQWLCKKHHALLHGKRFWTKQMDFRFESKPDGTLEDQVDL
jgi:hypothetical protein